jgi:hypothetical protein
LNIASGKSKIPLEEACFETIEKAFASNPILWLRVASLHENQPLKDSIDELIRNTTGSQLARGNYIASVIEHCGLVRYAMRAGKKGIELP